MLAALGLATIVALLVLVLTNRVSPLVALVAVPVVAALLGGFGLATGKFMVAGVRSIAPVAGMFVFAIVFFGVVSDAGMLDPIIDGIVRTVGTRPTRIAVGSALLALLIHLDGSGAVCFLITIPAMLPLYDRLRMDRRVLAAVASLAAGVNFLPWTGPTIRAAGVLKVPAGDLFRPLLPVQAVGLAFVFATAWLLGKREERRLGLAGGAAGEAGAPAARALSEEEAKLRRPRNFWANVALTLAVAAAMVSGKADPMVAFMIAAVLALVINYPDVEMQRARVDAHAKAALMMAGILLAAGAFTGIMQGTKMLTAMAQVAVGYVPHQAARHIPFGLGLVAMPLSLVFDPDSYYFGVMPVIAEVVRGLGGQPLHVAQASLLGQMTTGFPVSPLTPATFLVVGLTGIDLGVHQRFTIPLLFLASVLMTVAAAAFGVIPL